MKFELRHLFHFVTASAMYFALERVTGMLLPLLLLGLVICWTAIVLLRIDNMLSGALTGALLAIFVAAALSLAFDVSSLSAAMLWIAYPIAGYVVGLISAADRGFRSAM